ncbi:MAG: ATP-binding protein [Desulfobacteraceae bacterium]|nr:MAG: ATP-binding protein [Desulfobacteraceae bacterium]
MTNSNNRPRALSVRLPAPGTRRIVVITGARQTGKTTLSRARYGKLRYLNLDAPENRQALRELSTFAWANTVGEAVIDEAQKEPAVFDKVKFAFDEGRISFTVLTGSSQILLLSKIRESLAGRAFFYELWPLMQCELSRIQGRAAGIKPPLLDQILASESVGSVLGKIPEVILEEEDVVYREAEGHILKWGGMPALLDLPDEERWEWLKNYGYTYLERDMADLTRMSDLMPFRKFQRLSALRSAMLLNYSDLARDSGISVDTAKRYLEYLRVSYQAILLQPYHKNLTSSVIKTPKLYWADIGVLRQLVGLKGDPTGQIYETMVVAEIFKWIRTSGLEADVYFYRTRSGMEIDLLIETPAGLFGIEIKSRASVAGKDFTSMLAVAESVAKEWRGGLVIHTGNRVTRLSEHDIWAIPSRRLLQ